jgi:hypothetical protein
VWTALLAFAGGVAAVALKGYVDYVLERRREHRALQVAARLVYEELWGASAGIATGLFMGRVPAPEQFTESAWDENKALIGGAVDFEHWRLVLSGYYSVAGARELSAKALGKASSREITSARLQVQLADCQHSIAIACDVVGALITGFDKDPFPTDPVVLSDEVIEQANREWPGTKSGTE